MFFVKNGDVVVFSFKKGKKMGSGELFHQGDDVPWRIFPVSCAIREREKITQMMADAIAVTHTLSRAELAYFNYAEGVFKYIFRDGLN